MKQHRREFIKQASAASLISFLLPLLNMPQANAAHRRPRILLRSSWQAVNIGDIGHTFGIMELFKKYMPTAEVILWPVSRDAEVDALMQKVNPGLTVVSGNAASPAIQKIFRECDVMVHGSGPYVAAHKDVRAWWEHTGKPFGIYGVSFDEVDAALQSLLNNAAFIFCRDSASLHYLRSLRLKCPVQELGLDATFAINLHNPAKAIAFLEKTGLKKGEFICVIPRLRYTPYWQMRNTSPSQEDLRRYTISLQHKETDAAKLRDVIIRWVKETGLKVLVCAEVTYQVEFSKEVLVTPLPEEIKKNIVWRDTFWTPDEAGDIYACARAMVSYEMHSPIIAFTENVPAIYLKQPTDTRKGQMWRDIGLADWIFDIDETPASQISNTVMDIHHDYDGAMKRIHKAKQFVTKLQETTMQTVKNTTWAKDI